MIQKRVRQFYINATDKMSKNDYEYVNEILNDKELRLFTKLLNSEQKHCVRIAKEVEYMIYNNLIDDDYIIKNKDILIKAALLHDIGKIKNKVNIIEKSIIVILNKLTKGNLKKIEKSKKIQCYYNHSKYSYEILAEILDKENTNNYDTLMNIVKNHHNETDDKIIVFFQSIDDKN